MTNEAYKATFRIYSGGTYMSTGARRIRLFAMKFIKEIEILSNFASAVIIVRGR